MTTTITARIPAAPAADNTKRVATVGATEDAPPSFGGDTWGGSWGGAWGRTWYLMTAGSAGVPASPAADNTPRIGSAPTANNTKRVTLA
jgi:hypothetical protein